MPDVGQAIDFKIKDRPEPNASELKPEVRVVSDKYFRTMELPMVGGQGITGTGQSRIHPRRHCREPQHRRPFLAGGRSDRSPD